MKGVNIFIFNVSDIEVISIMASKVEVFIIMKGHKKVEYIISNKIAEPIHRWSVHFSPAYHLHFYEQTALLLGINNYYNRKSAVSTYSFLANSLINIDSAIFILLIITSWLI